MKTKSKRRMSIPKVIRRRIVGYQVLPAMKSFNSIRLVYETDYQEGNNFILGKVEYGWPIYGDDRTDAIAVLLNKLRDACIEADEAQDLKEI